MICLGCLRLVLAALSAASQAGATGNPFRGQKLHVSPSNYAAYNSAIETASGNAKKNLMVMQKVPSAYWIDVREKIKGSSTRHLEGILKDAASKTQPELLVLIWYDLPNRDCDAKASRGEICCVYAASGLCDFTAASDCSAGINEYKTTYVHPFIEVLQAYQDRVPIVIVMEPDSIANIATNTGNPHCGNPATKRAYTEGIKYAVNQLTSKTPKVTLYLDAAHGGWLGWEDNLVKFMSVLKGMRLPLNGIRGFATNVANYQPLGSLCPYQPDQGYRNAFCLGGKHGSHPCCEDHCGLSKQYSFGNNELNFAKGLAMAARGELGMTAHVIIDTGRSDPVLAPDVFRGKISRVAAQRSRTTGCTTAWQGAAHYMKLAARCALASAGQWYDFQVKQLATNANFNGSAHNQPPPPERQQHLPQPLPQQQHHRSEGQCDKAYSQCGGLTFSGTSCCEEGCQCKGSNDYYSQCVPRDPRRGTCAPPVLQELNPGFLSRGRRGVQVS